MRTGGKNLISTSTTIEDPTRVNNWSPQINILNTSNDEVNFNCYNASKISSYITQHQSPANKFSSLQAKRTIRSQISNVTRSTENRSKIMINSADNWVNLLKTSKKLENEKKHF